jgi:hypothetical protein
VWVSQVGFNSKEIHDRWVDTIGNLTLTGYNSELGNATFDEKKAKLQNTHFELSRSLLTQSRWGSDEIEERGKYLADIAVRRWDMSVD